MPFTHSFSFDPAYGYDEAALRRVPAPEGPGDFDPFWRATREEALAVPLRIERRAVASPDPAYAVEEVHFDSLGGVRIGAWLSVPRAVPIERAAVVGHGYGGRDEPAFRPAAIALAVCVRGFGLSRSGAIPGEAMRHVLHGIETREGYVLRGCVADLWAGASVLEALFPRLKGRIDYDGSSFGGGLGALALPWEPRWSRAHLDVPTFGNHPLRVTLHCEGSGLAVRARWKQDPAVLDVLGYFDAATAAKRIAVPTVVSAACFDPAVPPPGQFAVANAVPAEVGEVFVREAGHYDHPGFAAEEARLAGRLSRLWKR
ncbi:cephalosporin-C deacetylase [Verrucomicrobium sp. GAS474]|uniref:acetylxylan esterase n=1 Tax=Verrucomicrobium sp. GAS474 TaxID=1882831 RepID=UPI00087ABD0A|nr:acetylxylan esterase [Verrucomicrobium sp. GAS474]SDU06069.1 cephalosporin-C deacetylase [Verrucomicrobium sp. GAS474]